MDLHCGFDNSMRDIFMQQHELTSMSLTSVSSASSVVEISSVSSGTSSASSASAAVAEGEEQMAGRR